MAVGQKRTFQIVSPGDRPLVRVPRVAINGAGKEHDRRPLLTNFLQARR